MFSLYKVCMLLVQFVRLSVLIFKKFLRFLLKRLREVAYIHILQTYCVPFHAPNGTQDL